MVHVIYGGHLDKVKAVVAVIVIYLLLVLAMVVGGAGLRTSG